MLTCFNIRDIHTLFICEDNIQNVMILRCFEVVSRLKVNFHKSNNGSAWWEDIKGVWSGE